MAAISASLPCIFSSGKISLESSSYIVPVRFYCGVQCRRKPVQLSISAINSVNSAEYDEKIQLTRTGNGRRALLISLLLPFVPSLNNPSFFSTASATEEEAVRLEKIRTALRKAVTKGKAPGVLRLVFHDAGPFNLSTNTGGMNGSVRFELERPENQGLKRPVKVLEKVKAALEPDVQVSWADLIAVAGAEAVAVCGGPKIDVELGRVDSIKPDPEGQMPEESLNGSQLREAFEAKGFSTQELVALSGAHSIGGKGFGDPNVFDNIYYKILLQKPWFEKGGDEMAKSMIGLDSDRALPEDEQCLKWVKIYAQNQNLFFEDFISAYKKLVNTGAQWV